MFKKLLHRITVVWCLYGLVRLCIFLNPWAFRIIKITRPPFGDDYWDIADTKHIIVAWFLLVVAIGIIAAISAAIHHFSNWFFNTSNENEEG